MKARIFQFVFLILPFFLAGSLSAKEYDPALSEASRLAYEGKVQQAEPIINTYIQNHPEDPNGLFIKVVVLDWKARFNAEPLEPAQQRMLEISKQANDLAFQNWHKNPDNIDALIDLGNSYIFLGRKYADVDSWLKAVLTAKKCQQHLEKALKLDPNRVDGLMALGGFHYFAGNTPPGAAPFKTLFGIKGTKTQGLTEVKRSIQGKHPFVLDAKYALFYITFDNEKNYDEALRLLAELDAELPENPELKFKRAEVYEKQGKLKGAEGFLALAQWCEGKPGRCHPNYLFLAYYHAGRLLKDEGQNEKAKTYFAKALPFDAHLYPNLTAEALYWPGLIEQAEGKVDLAIEKFQKAKSIPGVHKKLRKEIEQSLEVLCKAEGASQKC